LVRADLELRAALVAWCGLPALVSANVGLESAVYEAGSSTRIERSDALVADLFRSQATSLVRLARLFVDDRNAAEDLVQEAFIRLARSAHRIADRDRAPAYLRSIVLNLARDHNRRGLVSLRHRLPFEFTAAGVDDSFQVLEDQRRVLEALRELPHRQRTCLVLRYYDQLGIDDIAGTLGVSRNSVKTHLQRGLAALEMLLAKSQDSDAS
jgi:RNA polymerase sigma-70 factor (ECF subfamily)